MDTHPVQIRLEPPARWARIHVALRLGILVCLGVVGVPLGYLYGVLYIALPVLAAVLISQLGGAVFLDQSGPRIVRIMHVWHRVLAYLLFLTDRFPTRMKESDDLQESILHFEVARVGEPRVGTALLRWLSSLPELIVLIVLASIAGIVWLIAAVCVLVVERVPRFATTYLSFLLAFQARFLAYHASLVDVHALGTQSASRAARSAST